MRIRRLSIRNYRLLTAVDIEPSDGLNVLFGDNAAGKTTFLESIIALSRGRTSAGNPKESCGGEGHWWRVEAWRGEDPSRPGELLERLRMQWEGGLGLFINEQPATARSLSRQMIVAAVDPRSHDLLDFGPSQRRRFLDWALFHVEPSYVETWSRWRRTLEQRNRALQTQGNDQATWAWDRSLVELAMEIHRHRTGLVAAIGSDVNGAIAGLFGSSEVVVDYEAGWSASEDYESALSRQRPGDIQAGRTRSGPQRGDLRIQVGGRDAEKLSRGQQKLLLSGLMISASRHVARCRGSYPVLLLDDLESELGRKAQEQLSSLLLDYPGQRFVTQHRRETALTQRANASLFHVEHGKVTLTIQ